MVYFQQIFSAFIEKSREVLSHLNWVDLIAIIIVVRTLYIGVRKGLLIEMFKLAGFSLGIFLAVTQFRQWGAALSEKSALPLQESEVISFLALLAMVYSATLILRLLFVRLFSGQTIGWWPRLAGGCVGVLRGCLVVLFLVVLTLAFSSEGYVAESIQAKSFLVPSLLEGGKHLYQAIHRLSDNFVIETVKSL